MLQLRKPSNVSLKRLNTCLFLPSATVIKGINKMNRAMPPAPTFLATLALLSYRLLFHSERELNISSLLFCTACAWSVAQLAHMYVTNEATDG